MFKNFLTIAIRNFARQAGYSALNILGLTVGIAASLIILLYLTEELSFDRYHEKSDRIFRISSDITEPDDQFRWAVTQVPLAITLKQDYAEVEEFVRFVPNGGMRFEINDKVFLEESVYGVDSTVFDIFSFEFVKGDPETALDEPNTIVLSQRVADKIFGDENPIGKSLESDGDERYVVKGVYKDMPRNSHLIANAMISLTGSERFYEFSAGSWGGFNIYSYVLLKEGAAPAQFEAKLSEVIEKYVKVIFDQFDITVKYELIGLTDIHLYSDFQGEPEPLGDITYIYIFAAIGLFILLIAVINYINLSTARGARRALEVGIRKVLGSHRSQLIGQFLSESILYTLLALVLSIGLVMLMVPGLNLLLDVELNVEQLLNSSSILIILGIAILVGVIGGGYPAFFLSGFAPVKVLKGKYARGSSKNPLRKILVITQFAISIFMLIGTGIIYDQMAYVQSKDLGFDKEQVLRFRLNNRTMREKWPVLRDQLQQNPNISLVATASSSPGYGYPKNVMSIENNEGAMEQKGIDHYSVDFDFFPALGMSFVAGRNFSREFSTDSTLAVVVNEAMVRRMNWEEPIGKRFQFGRDSTRFLKVIGIVKDFHQRSLYNPIEALMFSQNSNNRLVHVKITQQVPETIDAIKADWAGVFPTVPFEYSFVDEEFLEQYQTDQRRGKLFLGFALMTIFIACLGLLGLASFTATQRTKEVSIRKVMGAETSDILVLLTKEFVLLVLIAAIPAFAAAWYFMSEWLQSFEYHISMNYVIYGIALFATAVITVITTGVHALKAARTNPADTLKYE